MRRAIDRFQSAALLVLGAVAFVYSGPSIDKLFPVVDPFVVTHQRIEGSQVIISGWLRKQRECTFVEAVGRVIRSAGAPISVPFDFLDTMRTYTRPLGVQEWGPWRVVVPRDAVRVEISALHDCHPLWKTTTSLATIDIPHIEQGRP